MGDEAAKDGEALVTMATSSVFLGGTGEPRTGKQRRGWPGEKVYSVWAVQAQAMESQARGSVATLPLSPWGDAGQGACCRLEGDIRLVSGPGPGPADLQGEEAEALPQGHTAGEGQLDPASTSAHSIWAPSTSF